LYDEFDRMRRSRRNSRSGLDVPNHIQSKVFREVRPGAMIGHNLPSAIWSHLPLPALLGIAQSLIEIRKSLLKVGSVCRIEFAEFAGDSLGDTSSVVGIKPVVWISERMDVALGAGHFSLRDLEDLGKLGGIEVAVGSRLNSSISRLRNQRRQPSDFQIKTDTDEQVGISQFKQEAWLCFHKVRVLIALGDRVDIDLVAADLLRKCG